MPAHRNDLPGNAAIVAKLSLPEPYISHASTILVSFIASSILIMCSNDHGQVILKRRTTV